MMRAQISACILVFVSGSATAQLPMPRLDSIFPNGAKVGSEVEVTLAGSDIADISTILVDGPGIAAAKIDGLKFKLTIASDAPRGLRELRAVGKFGVSTPRTFVVGDEAVVVDDGKNHTMAAAQTMSVPGAVAGIADAEKVNFYKFSAKQNQKLAVNCISQALDMRMDPEFVIRDSAGRTLVRATDTFDRDAALEFVAPGDGEYFVVVNDHLYAGGPQYQYRLTITPAPIALPVSVGPSACAAENLPAVAGVAEAEPNDSPDKAQKLALPADISGKLDRDWFNFDAVKGKAYRIDVFAERLNQRADPVLVIRKVGVPKPILELDDTEEVAKSPRWLTESRDPGGRFVAEADGAYEIHLAARSGAGVGYRLLVREETPDFSLLAMTDAPHNDDKKVFAWQSALRRGGGVYFQVAALRRGYDGEITLRAEGLPEGVRAGGVIPAGSAAGFFAISAGADAKAWAGFFKLTGEGGGVTRTVHGVSYRWNVDNRDEQRLDARLCGMALGIIEEPAPMVIEAVESKEWEAPLGGTLEIPLKLSRPVPLAVPKGEWQLAPVGLPGLVKFTALKVDGGANEAKLSIKLENKDGNSFSAGTYALRIQARGTVAYKSDEKAGAKDLKHVEISGPITVKVIEAPKATAAK